jgi:PPOX class probable F420-dependent enzyme
MGNTGSEAAMSPFERFSDQRTILLTTYRKDGTPVGTPVHIAVDGAVADVRTFDPSGTMKRMRRDAHVEIAPSTVRGKVRGPALAATSRILEGAEAEHAAAVIADTYPVLHGHLIPWLHRRTGRTTQHIELRAA